MIVKIFPATLDGLSSAVLWKHLHPRSNIVLGGYPDDILNEFPQFKRFVLDPKKEKIETQKCQTSKLLKIMRKRKRFILPDEDVELFTFAIYSKTNGLLSFQTDEDDILALDLCLKAGIKIGNVVSKFSTKTDFRAADIMTKPVTTAKIGSNLKEIKKIIDNSGLTGLPVVDDDRHALGMITKKDIDRAMKSNVDDLSIVMSIPVITVKPEETIQKTGELMAVHDVGRIVVVDNDGRVMGIITRRDLVRAISRSTNEYRMIWNIRDQMNKTISPELFSTLKEIGEFAFSKGLKIYAVGGFVRDILMGNKSLDIDLVVEGDGIEFALEFATLKNVRCITHPEFGTSKIEFDGISMDIATARTEYYESPGALPKVEKSNLRRDLYRRDFTINAMAIDLTPQNFGTMIDFFDGMKDLKNGEIRVLHNLSFIEDPTRILRVLRYMCRFNYKLAQNTETLLENAIKKAYLLSVSASRIRTEFEKSIENEKAYEIFTTYQKYGIFSTLYCESNVDFKRFFNFSKTYEFEKINVLYAFFIIILQKCPIKRALEILKAYGVPSKIINVIGIVQDSQFISSVETPLSDFDLYEALKPLPLEALLALSCDGKIEKNIFRYVDELSKIKLEKINGAILKEKYGMKGMQIRNTLDGVLRMKMNLNIDEEAALKKITGDLN